MATIRQKMPASQKRPDMVWVSADASEVPKMIARKVNDSISPLALDSS